MHYCRLALQLTCLAFLCLWQPLPVFAETVGHFTQVEGSVLLLKGGKYPRRQARLQEAVESQDVIQTQFLSKAVVKFVDNTTLTISPNSKVAIERFVCDVNTGRCQAVFNVFKGLVHAAVTKIFKTKQMPVLMKTHNVLLGVRGTQWFMAVFPIATEVYNESGQVSLRALDRQNAAETRSEAFLPQEDDMLLPPMTYSRAELSSSPSHPKAFSRHTLRKLYDLMETGLPRTAVSVIFEAQSNRDAFEEAPVYRRNREIVVEIPAEEYATPSVTVPHTNNGSSRELAPVGQMAPVKPLGPRR